METIEKYLATPRILGAHIEFTTNCNLRCSYCAVSQPGYKKIDFDLTWMDELIDNLKSLNIEELNISGHGETTSVKDWHIHVNKLMDAGFRVTAITNLSKLYTREEIETLARFHYLTVSVDTFNPELFKKLRRGGDLGRVIFNMTAIRGAAHQMGYPPTPIGWTSIVCGLNVFDLPFLVHVGLTQQVCRFTFMNLVRYPDVKGSIQLMPLSEMSETDQKRVPSVFDEITTLLETHIIPWEIQPGITEFLEQVRLSGTYKPSPNTNIHATVFRDSHTENEGLTRDCMDPWSAIHISAAGMVRPCCIMQNGRKVTETDHTLEEIINGEWMAEIRKGLLTGQMIDECSQCHSRGWISREALAQKVSDYYENRPYRRISQLKNRRFWHLPIKIWQDRKRVASLFMNYLRRQMDS